MSENLNSTDKKKHHRKLPLLPGLGLSAEARGLLAAYACASKFARIGREDLKELAAGLCQTTPVTKRAVEELVASGLWAEAPFKGASGRPKVGYIGSARLRELVEGDTSYPLGELVDHVLQPSNRLASMYAAEQAEAAPLSLAERKRQYRKQLRQKAAGATRWLLAVLLAHADRWGVVQGLGAAKLMDLTGLNQERLKAHLFKLSELGFISHQLPGFSGWSLLSKWGTVYFLNLHHPDLRNAYPVSTIVVMDARSERRVPNVTEAGLIVNRADFQSGADFDWDQAQQAFLGLPIDAHDSGDDLARYFLSQRPSAQVDVITALQFVLEQLASQLLSDHWDSLEQVEADDLRESVRGLLKASKRHEVPMDRIELMLARVVIALARRVKRWLEPFRGLAVDVYDYRLLPVANVGMVGSDGGVRCVLLRPKKGEPTPAVFVSAKRRPAKHKFEEYPWKNSPLLSVPRPLTRYGRGVQRDVDTASE